MTERGVEDLLIRKNPIRYKFVEVLVNTFAEITFYGEENLNKIREVLKKGHPVQIYPNHLSHADAPVLFVSFAEKAKDIEDKLFAMVGMVVVDNLFTRQLIPYNGVKIPSQRKTPGSEDGWVKRQEMTNNAFVAVKQKQEAGEVLVNYAEGGRSRSGGMIAVKPAIAKYFDLLPDTWVVPVGQWGGEKIMKIGSPIPRFGRAWVRVGEPIAVSDLKTRVPARLSGQERDRKVVNELMGEVAALLPEQYRGYYAKT